MTSEEPAIAVRNVSKTFRLPHDLRTTAREYVLHPFRRTTYEVQRALHDVSFDVAHGEFFAVIGPNGSGKSTLLKILSGIYRSDGGSVLINGKLSPFIELGVGFNPELNARDNVRINGTLLGLSPRQLDERFDEIIGFAELERFVDQRLKNYSSGMQVRLAYSIAIQVPFDILLLDEVLAVGDQNFQEKCFATFEEMRREGKTVLLVTHDLRSVSYYCDRTLLLRDGVVEGLGEPQQVVETYLRQERARLEAAPVGERTLKEQRAIERLAQSADEILESAAARRRQAKAQENREAAASDGPDDREPALEQQRRPESGAASVAELEDKLAETSERLQSIQRIARRRELVLNAVLDRYPGYMDIPPVELRIVDELSYLAKGVTTSEIVLETFGRDPSGPILEWGAGDGRTARWLMPFEGWQACYHGCDSSQGSVDWLAAQGVPNVRVLANPSQLPYQDGAFAGAFSFSIPRLHPNDYRALFDELRRTLAPRAAVVVGIHGPRAGQRLEKPALQIGWASLENAGTDAYVVTDDFVRTAVDGLLEVENVTLLSSHGYSIYKLSRAPAASGVTIPSAATTGPKSSNVS